MPRVLLLLVLALSLASSAPAWFIDDFILPSRFNPDAADDVTGSSSAAVETELIGKQEVVTDLAVAAAEADVLPAATEIVTDDQGASADVAEPATDDNVFAPDIEPLGDPAIGPDVPVGIAELPADVADNIKVPLNRIRASPQVMAENAPGDATGNTVVDVAAVAPEPESSKIVADEAEAATAGVGSSEVAGESVDSVAMSITDSRDADTVIQEKIGQTLPVAEDMVPAASDNTAVGDDTLPVAPESPVPEDKPGASAPQGFVLDLSLVEPRQRAKEPDLNPGLVLPEPVNNIAVVEPAVKATPSRGVDSGAGGDQGLSSVNSDLSASRQETASAESFPQERSPLNSFTEPTTGMTFVLIKGGCYLMGSSGCSLFTQCSSNEEPAHEVCVDDFWMGTYEVTQAQWQRVMGENPSRFDDGRRPVEQVNWNDALDFLSRLSRDGNHRYRLPTEAEWEYAARNGGVADSFGASEPIGQYAWYKENSGGQTHPVGQKRPNALGLYDMSGNVREWCADGYDIKYYATSPRDNPPGPSGGMYRAQRGGGWLDNTEALRPAARKWSNPDYRVNFLGFRVVFPAL